MNIPDSKVHVIKGAGHACYLQNPEEFNEVLRNFLEELETETFHSVRDEQLLKTIEMVWFFVENIEMAWFVVENIEMPWFIVENIEMAWFVVENIQIKSSHLDKAK